jgi:methionyl aminopeptidase
VVHGIPRTDKIINAGDIVSVDFGVLYKGLITDAALSFIVGNADKKVQALVSTTEEAMYTGIKKVKDGVKTGDIGYAIQSVLDTKGYGIVQDLVGHGVGHQLHEDPNVPNYGHPGTGDVVSSGMTIAIEPMATLGTYKVFVKEDNWTIVTQDGSWAAHFEHTVLITDKGAEILTKI